MWCIWTFTKYFGVPQFNILSSFLFSSFHSKTVQDICTFVPILYVTKIFDSSNFFSVCVFICSRFSSLNFFFLRRQLLRYTTRWFRAIYTQRTYDKIVNVPQITHSRKVNNYRTLAHEGEDTGTVTVEFLQLRKGAIEWVRSKAIAVRINHFVVK